MCLFVELSGKQFQTFNVHQLLHLAEVVRDLGPLWSNSCFPFEDYNGDLRDLFHGTKNVDGQVCFLTAHACLCNSVMPSDLGHYIENK